MEQPIQDLSETRKKTEDRLKKSFQQKLNAMANASPKLGSPEGSVERGSIDGRSKDRIGDRTQTSGGESIAQPLSQRTQRVTFKGNNTTFSSAVNKSQVLAGNRQLKDTTHDWEALIQFQQEIERKGHEIPELKQSEEVLGSQ